MQPQEIHAFADRFKAFLPTGDYLVSADDIPGAIAARLNVGPERTSSANDLEIP